MDEATAERLSRKVGGRFKLATLVMKRLIEINRGSQLLVETHTDNLLEAVLKEVDLDLVRLVPRLPAPAEGEEEKLVVQAAEPEPEAEEAAEEEKAAPKKKATTKKAATKKVTKKATKKAATKKTTKKATKKTTKKA